MISARACRPGRKIIGVQAVEEPLILSVDTATEVRSVAVVRGAQLLALEEGEGNTHSANVLNEIDSALGAAGVDLKSVGLYAAASGPGSFTGLRAGLSTLKAFAATLRRPVVGVPTLYGVAHAAVYGRRPKARLILAAIPAGRGEFFAQFLSVTADGRVGAVDAPPQHLPPGALLDRAVGANRPLTFAGSGAHLLAAQLSERALEAGIPFKEESAEGEGVEESGWTLARPARVLAEHFAALARDVFLDGQAVDADKLGAIYVRPSDAEIKEQCRAQNPPPK